MNIATINDNLLPVVLFVIYFVFVSVLQYNLKDKANVTTNKKASKKSLVSPKPFTHKDAFSKAFDPDPIAEITEEIVTSVESDTMGNRIEDRTEEIVAAVEPEMTQKIVTERVGEVTNSEPIDEPITTHLNHQSIPEIIDRLGKRDIRKLCSPLGIQQKTNGTELTTELMKALVKRKFKENPQMVVEIMSDRFSSLMSTSSKPNQQQQLDPLAC
jgi:hypothetical protein